MPVATILSTTDLDAMVEFLVERVGARLESISPADDPSEIRLDVQGSPVWLRRSEQDVAGHLVVLTEQAPPPATVTAPNGTVVEFRPVTRRLDVPPSAPSFSLVRAGDRFGAGRAGMGYRDLLPGRWGGRFIASHILIAEGGEVPDYVHFHRIRFQMIFCARGWVDLVYEDQGPPFRLRAGDCVLQPPEIRHRVLRSSPGLQVIEVGCPAVHDTFVEHDMTLPTSAVAPDRGFSGQRFVRHVAAEAPRIPYRGTGLVHRDTGIGAATDGLAGAVVIEAGAPIDPAVTLTHDDEFVLEVVLAGEVTLDVDVGDGSQQHLLGEFDAVALPPGSRWRWEDPAAGCEMLEVTLGAGAVTVAGP